MLAGLAIGFWNNTQELAASWQEECYFEPRAENSWRETLLKQWQKAINRT
jgi:glycerol kinase